MSPSISAQKGCPADISQIIKYAPSKLVGRRSELKLLNTAWTKARRNVENRPRFVAFVAFPGEGKTCLVARWAVDLELGQWPDCDGVFAWSFYNQGTRDQSAVSSEPFLTAAINFFGSAKDKEFAASSVGAREKGIRLAHIVGARRCLLILDGIEPLQYAPTSPTPGEFKDGGIAVLFKGLAASSHGLCIVTTRCTLSGLKAYLGKTVEEKMLPRLSTAAGVELLQRAGVVGSLKKGIRVEVDGCEIFLNEFEQLVEDVAGHALTLQILGGFLTRAYQGDIRRRDRIDLRKADAKNPGRTRIQSDRGLCEMAGTRQRRFPSGAGAVKAARSLRPTSCGRLPRSPTPSPSHSRPDRTTCRSDRRGLGINFKRLARVNVAHGEPG